jgi:hypothetical protein
MEFSVSVVIPVFNGAGVIEKAVRSAIQQPEVTEVMIIVSFMQYAHAKLPTATLVV